ncbi:MAG TPA: ammonia-forming cytochrome c nitrite reductase subunit c552 [Bryobacteraceae bacterium]
MVWRGVLLVLAVLPLSAAGDSTYVGAAVCAKCHADAYSKWSGSRHSKMVQPATRSSVQGDFTRGRIELRGAPYLLREREGVFYITESYLTGKPQEHRVDYTLGNRRIQHYLTRLPSGRVIVLPPSWDILRKQWFHNFEIGDPDETSEVTVQVWNKNCYSCHVSQQEKNFDTGKNEYKTAWLDFGTNCERCHGPGSRHVANYSASPRPAGPVRDIVLQTRLDADRNTMVCAQCHSFRDIYALGYTAGADYYDFYLPILEYSQPVDHDPAYWPDGRTRRFSNDAFGLWQSECFLKGKVTCVGCHVTPHEVEIERNPQLRPDANALCTRCHAEIGKAGPAHTHHAATSAGSSCVECHMPRTVLSIKAQIRDHSMSIPVPENTIRHNIPNACNGCHQDRDANWSLKQMKAWYGDASRQKLIRRADAFAQAQTGDPAAVAKLLDILAKPAEGQLVRANALGHLSRFSKDPRVFAAFAGALDDPQPLVRAVAALRISPAQSDRPSAITALTRSLGDSATTVRVASAVALVSLGVSQLPGEDGERFERAKQVFRARAALNSDDAEQQLGAGRFYLLTGDPVTAITALEGSLKLDPEVPAQYYLAYAYAQQGKMDDARRILLAIPPADSQYARAQTLLKAIAGRP